MYGGIGDILRDYGGGRKSDRVNQLGIGVRREMFWLPRLYSNFDSRRSKALTGLTLVVEAKGADSTLVRRLAIAPDARHECCYEEPQKQPVSVSETTKRTGDLDDHRADRQ